MAERSGDVGNGFAGLQRDQFLGAFAYRLNDQGNGASAGIRIGDGQRNALRALAPTHNDELPRLPDLRDTRRHDIQAGDVRAKLGFGDNVMHAGIAYS